MSRPTDFERGARLALYAADLHCMQGELFPGTDHASAALRDHEARAEAFLRGARGVVR